MMSASVCNQKGVASVRGNDERQVFATEKKSCNGKSAKCLQLEEGVALVTENDER
jgi:hypothetical protein